MKIAVLSGKGGTGKTTVSTNLAYIIENSKLYDADVEEPNADIFLKMKDKNSKPVMTNYPEVDMDKCKLCGKCGDFCHFNAIIPAKNDVVIFKELCHDCGGCKIVCPYGAIEYIPREIGKIVSGIGENSTPIEYGELNIGEMSGVKIIENLKDKIDDSLVNFIDSPPGTSCATVAAIENVDFAVLVSEPTPFGVSDMKMVVEMLRNMEIPFAVVVNKAGLGDDEIYEYCSSESISIIGEIPFDKKYAEFYSNGDIISEKADIYRNNILGIWNNIQKGVNTNES